MDGKGKGGGDDHRPDQLEQNMPGGGDVGHPVDGGLLQELFHLPPHPVNGHTASGLQPDLFCRPKNSMEMVIYNRTISIVVIQ